MGMLDTIREGFREGAADVLGFSEKLAEGDWAMSALQEAGYDARMLARKVEDLNWDKINESPAAYFTPSRENRREQVARSYNFYFNDPIIRRTVDLRTYYTFAKGVPLPIYRREHEDASDEEREAQDLIDNFWGDEFNQETLTSPKAQYEKSLEVQLQGNVYLLGFLDMETPHEKGSPSPLRLSDIPEPEIVEIITHPGNRKVPVYYKRVFKPTEFNFDNGNWSTESTGVTRYYKHWKHEPPTEWEGKPWGPPEELIGKGRVYHISVNHTSDMKWGLTELNSHLKFAAGLNTYMTSRMAMVMALAKLAMQAKTHGGPRSVSQVQGALRDITRLASSIEGTAGAERIPINQGRTKVAMSSKGVQLQPAVQDTGAQAAAADTELFKSMIAAGSAVPVHHLGGGGGSLATATAMDGPLQKNIEANQTLWETVFKDLISWMLVALGFESERVEVDMPPILAKDFSTLVTSLAAAIKAVDPNTASRELCRFFFGETLDAMGKKNTQELLDKFFPAGWVSPAQEQAQMMLLLYQQQGGAEDAGGGAPPSMNMPTLPPTQIARAPGGLGFPPPPSDYGIGRQASPGQASHRGPQDYAGGGDSAGAEKRERAKRRYELALQGGDGESPAAPGLEDLIESVFAEANIDPELLEALPVDAN